jgi:hypothetical protein
MSARRFLTRRARAWVGLGLGVMAFAGATLAEHLHSGCFESVLLTAAVVSTVVVVSPENWDKVWFWSSLAVFIVLQIPLLIVIAPSINRFKLLVLPLGVVEFGILILALGFIEDRVLGA